MKIWLNSIVLVLVFLCGGWSVAVSKEIAGEPLDEIIFPLASIEKHIVLLESQKGDSNLRVSILMMDWGGSTDLSPKGELNLIMFNESEMKNTYSLHGISHANKLIGARRLSAGVYEVKFQAYNDAVYGDKICPESEIWDAIVTATIDAKLLSKHVRDFRNTGDLDDGVVTTPINVKFSCK